jgi:dynein light chain 1
MSKGGNATSCKEAIQRWVAKGAEIAAEQKTEDGEMPPNPHDPATSEIVTLTAQIPSIKKMDAKLNELVSCTHLALSTNNIERIQPLTSLKQLKILSLGRNNIKRIEKLDDVSNSLEQLWVSYNQIEKLDGLQSLRNLKTLYISNNNIKAFDELLKLRHLDKFEDLLLVGNPCYEAAEAAGLNPELQVLKRLPNLMKLDGKFIKPSDRDLAEEVETFPGA